MTSLLLALALTVARPSYNTGTGFFVLQGKLYSAPGGTEFFPHGFNLDHMDQSWLSCTDPGCGVKNSGANAAREFDNSFYEGSADARGMMTWSSDLLHAWQIAWMATCFTTVAGGDTTNQGSTQAGMESCVTMWTRSDFKAFYQTAARQKEMLAINIANEWGQCDSTYQTKYLTAIASLRSAGYLQPIAIDAGGSGEDWQCIVSYAQSFMDADPQHNIMMTFHPYAYDNQGYGTLVSAITSIQSVQATANANGAKPWGAFYFIIGEFGAKGSWGGTRTVLEQIAVFDSYGLGWLHWAWDDNGEIGCNGVPFCFLVTGNTGSPEPFNAFALQTAGAATGQPANCTVPGPCMTSSCNCTKVSDLNTVANSGELQASILDLTHGMFHKKYAKASIFGGASTPTLSAATKTGHSIPTFALVGSTVAITDVLPGSAIYWCTGATACAPARTTATKYSAPLTISSGNVVCARSWVNGKRYPVACATYTLQ